MRVPAVLTSETVSTRVVGSASSRPKNCSPALGGRLGGRSRGTPTKRASGPNVASRGGGANVPAWAGPATNSQNGQVPPCAAPDQWCAAQSGRRPSQTTCGRDGLRVFSRPAISARGRAARRPRRWPPPHWKPGWWPMRRTNGMSAATFHVAVDRVAPSASHRTARSERPSRRSSPVCRCSTRGGCACRARTPRPAARTAPAVDSRLGAGIG